VFYVPVPASCCLATEPKLVVMGTGAVERGSFPARRKRTGTFRLRNSGNADLAIRRVRQTCGCFTVAIDRTTLPPSVVTVGLAFTPTARPGRTFHPRGDHPDHIPQRLSPHSHQTVRRIREGATVKPTRDARGLCTPREQRHSTTIIFLPVAGKQGPIGRL